MKFLSIANLLAAALSFSTASAASVRGKAGDTGISHERRLGKSGCTFLIAADLSEKGVGHKEDSYQCQLDDNTSIPLIMSNSQRQTIKQMIEDGKVISNEYKYVDPEAVITPEGVRVPPGKAIGFEKGEGSQGSGRRRLAKKTGDTHYLVVRVIDVNNLVHPDSTAVMSDNMFGTSGDQVNLKTQISDCSAGQLNVVPGYPDSATTEQKAAVDMHTTLADHPVGVMEANIDIDMKTVSSRYDVRNAVISAVQTKLGFNLPGPFDHVVFNLEGCYVDCGWAAYAYINSWNQVYQGNYYFMTGVQVHEYGHNLGMAHSGGLNGATYTDHTCMMGNPLYSDDVGKMCFNPAKNFYIGWYNTGGIQTYTPSEENVWSGTLMGVGEWKDYPAQHPVVVKIETGTNTDYFVGFNRAAGANAENDEADDLVTIIETGNNGLSYSQSFLKGYIGAGQNYVFPNWQGTGSDLTVSVSSINIASNPGTATVNISLDGATAAPVTPSPTNAPVTPAPVTPSPTNAPVTPSPTNAPTTATPTRQPTSAPTSDGICNGSETCLTHPDDCISGTEGGAICGNGICEAGMGETCQNCALDCEQVSGGKPSGRYCCGNNGSCDNRCEQCTTGNTVIDYCCGDGNCEGPEDYLNCLTDCPAPGPTFAPVPTVAPDTPAPATPAPVASCGGKNAACSSDTDCCGAKICKNNGRCS